MNDALFIIDKPPMPAPDDTGPYEMPNGPKPISAAIDERNGELIVAAHNATIATLIAALEEARGALEVFAKVGSLIEGPFGPALFVGHDHAFKSGCSWTENGEKKTLTWGQFRRARATLATINAALGRVEG
jgi:hypothetical protein